MVGLGNDDYVEAVRFGLAKCAMATGNQPQVRSAALRALSLAIVVCSTDGEATMDAMKLCYEISLGRYRGSDVAPSLQSASLDCWGLLATTLEDDDISGSSESIGSAFLEDLKSCLDSTSQEVMSSAGSNVSLIHECRLSLGVSDESATSTDRKFGRGTWEGSPEEELMDDIICRMSELAQDAGRRISKKVKRSQKCSFRDFLATVADGEIPTSTIQFRGGSLTLQGWRSMKKISFVRCCLQSSFLQQLIHNPALQTMFSLDMSVLNAKVSMSEYDKRTTVGKCSERKKGRDKDIKRDRKKKIMARDAVLYE